MKKIKFEEFDITKNIYQKSNLIVENLNFINWRKSWDKYLLKSLLQKLNYFETTLFNNNLIRSFDNFYTYNEIFDINFNIDNDLIIFYLLKHLIITIEDLYIHLFKTYYGANEQQLFGDYISQFVTEFCIWAYIYKNKKSIIICKFLKSF